MRCCHWKLYKLYGPGGCGPAPCGLQCGGGQCVQSHAPLCSSAPCCAQWSCQHCPPTRPDFQGACQAAQEGLECEYGRQSCCGVTYPEVKLSCVEGLWQGYYVDTVCMFSGHVCPTTTSPAPCICPAVFSPVCATNNVTFSNACQAACGGLAPGCNGACPCPDCSCMHVWTPVCGGDGVTYSNAGCAACARAEVRCQ